MILLNSLSKVLVIFEFLIELHLLGIILKPDAFISTQIFSIIPAKWLGSIWYLTAATILRTLAFSTTPSYKMHKRPSRLPPLPLVSPLPPPDQKFHPTLRLCKSNIIKYHLRFVDFPSTFRPLSLHMAPKKFPNLEL